MATSAFKSTTKRTPIGTNPRTEDSGSSNRAHRRSRSLSQFSRPPEPEPYFGDDPAPKGRFVNTARGSDFPEISLDDLAVEFFPTKDSLDERDSDRGRLSRRSSEIRPSDSAMASSQRRGRSVSRHNSRSGDVNGNGHLYNAERGGVVQDSNSRKRRSVSVARYRISDSESDIDHSQRCSRHAFTKDSNCGNREMGLPQKPQASGHRRLERSVSHKDLSKSHDGYSSHSSTQTDDEARDAHSEENGIEKIIRAVYSQKKAEQPIGDAVNSGLYEAVRKELRYAVEEIRTELEQATVGKTFSLEGSDPLKSGNSAALRAVSAITKTYATKLEQSEKRKQDLLDEMALEEQRGKELSKIVRELLPDSKKSVVAQKPLQARKRSNDKNRMSKQLTEEAGKYFEDFISNVEDTDISSFDGERSDASSSLGGTKPRVASTHCGETKTYHSPAVYNNSLPVEMDGINFPWLKWDTANDGSPLRSKTKAQLPVTPKTLLWDAAQDEGSVIEDPSSQSTSSSRGSWSPGIVDSSNSVSKGSKSSKQRSGFDMEEYLKLERNEQLLFESWTQRHRISSGGLLLCNNFLF